MRKSICLAVSGLVLTACLGSGADLVKTYELTKPIGAPYSRILVVGAHPERAIRRAFEESLVDSLRADQIDAVASISLMDPEAPLGQETVAVAAEASLSDAVLVSRLRDLRDSATQPEARSSADALRRQSNDLFDFLRYDYVEYEDPLSLATVDSVVVASDLYRVSDRIKVWSVESTAVEKEAAMEELGSIASATSRRLRRDDLVR